ncbi:uncharacterized protein [Henckelia pumila]|uniref:uncharacterized protein n=1 Tax=Henckelia pumila TaxID=405737 RepID=UPI003C6E4EED
MALFARKFKRFMRGNNLKRDKKIEKEVTCYNSQQQGHYANECPLKKKIYKGKKKALIATWSDSDDDEEEANICLLTKDDDIVSDDDDEGNRKNVLPSILYLDSGCSRHMTGNKELLQLVKPNEKGTVTFGDNNKGVIEGFGSIGPPCSSLRCPKKEDGFCGNGIGSHSSISGLPLDFYI